MTVAEVIKEYKILATDSSETKWFVRWEELDCDFEFCDEFYLVPVTNPARAGSCSNRDGIEKELAALKEYGICWCGTTKIHVRDLELSIVEFTAELN